MPKPPVPAAQKYASGVIRVLVALLAACAAPTIPPPQGDQRRPEDFPDAYYQTLRTQGADVFRVDPVTSLVVIKVRRTGSLAQFGHDHVVASHDIGGYVAPEQRRADLYVPLEKLVVDEPALRAQAGMATQPTPADIAGTLRNMREKVLETSQFPYARIFVVDAANGTGPTQISAAITLHGTTQAVVAQTRIEQTPGEIMMTGTLAIDQSSFGIVPFSILGGAIAVEDRLVIDFVLRARRI